MTELTNLLPPDRLATQRQGYFLRLATVAVFALAGVALVSGIMLVPSYLYLEHQIQVRERSIAAADANLALSHGKETNARLSALSDTATYLARLATTTTATGALRGVLAVPRPGITLTGLTFTPPTHSGDGQMVLTGSAATREALRTYDDALTQLPFVANADLPISAYAKDADIPFTITLTGTLMP